MNLELLDEIAFHDAVISKYENDGNDIIFELEDGWLDDVFYELRLNNVKIEVINTLDEYICYVIDSFTNINENEIYLYAGEYGEINNIIDRDKYYLKLWIQHPGDVGIEGESTMNEFKFDGLNVKVSNDEDATGRLFIKFIVDSINLSKIDSL